MIFYSAHALAWAVKSSTKILMLALGPLIEQKMLHMLLQVVVFVFAYAQLTTSMGR